MSKTVPASGKRKAASITTEEEENSDTEINTSKLVGKATTTSKVVKSTKDQKDVKATTAESGADKEHEKSSSPAVKPVTATPAAAATKATATKPGLSLPDMNNSRPKAVDEKDSKGGGGSSAAAAAAAAITGSKTTDGEEDGGGDESGELGDSAFDMKAYGDVNKTFRESKQERNYWSHFTNLSLWTFTYDKGQLKMLYDSKPVFDLRMPFCVLGSNTKIDIWGDLEHKQKVKKQNEKHAVKSIANAKRSFEMTSRAWNSSCRSKTDESMDAEMERWIAFSVPWEKKLLRFRIEKEKRAKDMWLEFVKGKPAPPVNVSPYDHYFEEFFATKYRPLFAKKHVDETDASVSYKTGGHAMYATQGVCSKNYESKSFLNLDQQPPPIRMQKAISLYLKQMFANKLQYFFADHSIYLASDMKAPLPFWEQFDNNGQSKYSHAVMSLTLSFNFDASDVTARNLLSLKPRVNKAVVFANGFRFTKPHDATPIVGAMTREELENSVITKECDEALVPDSAFAIPSDWNKDMVASIKKTEEARMKWMQRAGPKLLALTD